LLPQGDTERGVICAVSCIPVPDGPVPISTITSPVGSPLSRSFHGPNRVALVDEDARGPSVAIDLIVSHDGGSSAVL